MSIKIILAVILSLACIILSGIGANIYVAYLQILLYGGIIALIVSRYHEDL